MWRAAHLLNVLFQLEHGALLIANAVMADAVRLTDDKRARKEQRGILVE
jgi:hypothetical protein